MPLPAVTTKIEASPRQKREGVKALYDLRPVADDFNRDWAETVVGEAQAWSIAGTTPPEPPSRGIALTARSKGSFYGRLSGAEVEAELQRCATLVKGLLRDFAIVGDTVWHLQDDRAEVAQLRELATQNQAELASLRAVVEAAIPPGKEKIAGIEAELASLRALVEAAPPSTAAFGGEDHNRSSAKIAGIEAELASLRALVDAVAPLSIAAFGGEDHRELAEQNQVELAFLQALVEAAPPPSKAAVGGTDHTGSSAKLAGIEAMAPVVRVPETTALRTELREAQQDLMACRAQGLAAQQELKALRSALKRHAVEFSVGQYNILAGYMGNNMEPWFLYGVDMPEERRKSVFKLHAQRGPDGKPANAGWPNYVRGVLSDEEVQTVERIHAEHFAWDQRKDRLVQVIEDMDSDVLSLVECDNFDDFFRPALEAMGYLTVWKKRPRPASADGCCVAWKAAIFELVAEHSCEYVDKYDPVTKRSWKDRIALMVLLRVKMTGHVICFVSTHLQRNPEDPKEDFLRARQVGQVLRELASFTREHRAEEAAVLLTGDLNCTSFGRLRGIANTVSLLSRDTFLHPFTFDCADVPTGVTSVTTARCMRIDAIMYQSQKLELVDVQELPELDPGFPIPNAQHPSDHVPIVAQFRNQLHSTRQVAKDWYRCLSGEVGLTPLSFKQLKNAFKLYDFDGTGNSTRSEVRKVLVSLFDVVHEGMHKVLDQVPEVGLDFDGFVASYLKAVKAGGMPGLEDFKEAFLAFDTDWDSTLALAELLDAFKTCAPAEVPEEELKQLFLNIDTSGDGRIDADEMTEYLAKVWVDSFDVQR
ncbi:unnamed protein product [Polarella glacialis]|uniref:EF-hand domain-containing protein n=1 Tax=Polarella glacialis TaxID=89957 RepID=A0A813GEU3_POLGL|nr:unnamed protein product [Polarella glacialis]